MLIILTGSNFVLTMLSGAGITDPTLTVGSYIFVIPVLTAALATLLIHIFFKKQADNAF